jgi:energy-coupling factor transport system ATP-binding protein
MLEARELSFSYDGKTPVLNSASITLQPGEIVLLTGATGSGKSTLAKCLSGFIPRIIEGEFSGSIMIDNKEVSQLSISEYAKKVSLVQQDPDGQICTLNVADEIAFGPENFGIPSNELDNLVTESLDAVDASHLRERSTQELSGGEKQRIIISSMLACQPNYLLLDEPSSSLDPRGTAKLRDVLTGLRSKGLGILIIEHQFPAFLTVADRILRISEGKIEPWVPDEPVSKSTRRPDIESSKPETIRMREVSFSYGTRKAINKVSITISQGELVALMGDNGSGKTTFLGVVAGLLQPDEGEILLEKTAFNSLKHREIAEKIGVVFQNPNHQIFERTVWKEHTLGLEVLGHDIEDYSVTAEQTLDQVGLLDMRERNPFSLSHGQKRRLNVSSVTIHKPKVFLFDEPFIGQDAEGRRIISQKMEDHVKTKGTCIVVTHDPIFARQFCNRIIFMDKGSILLDGPPHSVLSSLENMGRTEYTTVEVNSK